MAFKLCPVLNEQQFSDAGVLLSGGRIETYLAGSSTPATTYTTSTGAVAQSNPIVLNTRGDVDNLIYLTTGLAYKLVLKDSVGNVLRTFDNIEGINDSSLTIDQWVNSGVTPTYVNATTFTVSGDQTSIFTNKRRLKLVVSGGVIYASVINSTFTTLTTVTVSNDSLPIDSGLSDVQLGLITPNNTSLPSIVESFRSTIAATATTTPLWASAGQIQDWTGAPIITALPNAPMAGAWREVYPATGTIFTNNASMSVAGNESYTTQAGDKVYIEALTISVFKIWPSRKNGTALFLPSIIAPQSIGTIATIPSLTIDQSGRINAAVGADKIGLGAAIATTSGTSHTFTGISTLAKKITVNFNAVSTNGTSSIQVQIGATTIDAAGYDSTGFSVGTAGSSPASSTTGFLINGGSVAAETYTGSMTIVLHSGNLYISTMTGKRATNGMVLASGSKTTSGLLNILRVTTVNGTDVFDGGSVNILVE